MPSFSSVSSVVLTSSVAPTQRRTAQCALRCRARRKAGDVEVKRDISTEFPTMAAEITTREVGTKWHGYIAGRPDPDETALTEEEGLGWGRAARATGHVTRLRPPRSLDSTLGMTAGEMSTPTMMEPAETPHLSLPTKRATPDSLMGISLDDR